MSEYGAGIITGILIAGILVLSGIEVMKFKQQLLTEVSKTCLSNTTVVYRR